MDALIEKKNAEDLSPGIVDYGNTHPIISTNITISIRYYGL